MLKDPEIVEELKPWKAAVDALGNKVHGETRVQLDKSPCELGECQMGNLITDAFVHDFVKRAELNSWTYASIAVLNAVAVRNTINIGSKSLPHPYINQNGKYYLL